MTISVTEFDAVGRPKRSTNPYRANEAKIWTTTNYDVQGRPFEVMTEDGAKVTTAYGVAISGANIGTVVTVTDQALKQRRSITNALGQLTRVDEPNDAGQLDVNGVPAQPTNYSYDTLNNFVTVVQGQQTRTFAYDSLSRLKSANNPESGIINYVYDNNGNLTSKTDARQITTNYVYDNLNRVKTRSYLNEPVGQITPNVAYTYDNLTNAKGKLIKVANGTSTTEYASFDILGRVLTHKQTTDGNIYNSSYVYNLSGALIEEVYPSGRVVKNTLDVDGDLAQVQSKKSNGTLQNYANAFTYTSAGAVSSLRLGNGKFENTTFNSRLQPTQIGLGSSATSQNLLKLNFDYGLADNNGNVKSQTITTPTVGNIAGFVALQTYSYDSLNRLKDAKEMIGTNQQWKQTFTFDRYGNRTFDTANNNTTTLANGCPVAVCNPSANPQDNKLVGTNYDNVGNTKIDANGQTFIYDAENKQVQVNNASGIVGQYYYDGDGKRIKKFVPSTSETTIFVYDAGGKMVAEYSTVTASTTEAKISYLTNDHLGSPRITTDATGKVVSRRDFLPFGEEIQRANNGSDLVRQKFTGYERDGETELDYAKARIFGSGIGRFTSPDPLLSSGRIENPQTWNRYAYVLNNPLNFSDPLGLYEWSASAGGQATDEELLARSKDKTLSKNDRNQAKNQYGFRQQFTAGLKAAKDAASNTNLKPEQRAEAQRAVNSYGDYKKEDNVSVGMVANKNDSSSTGFGEKDGKIHIDLNLNLSDRSPIITIAHEGSHVADFQELVNARGTPSESSKDISAFATEQRAFFVSSYMAQALNIRSYYPGTSGDDQIWNKGWKENKREVNRTNGVTNKNYWNKDNSPGPNLSSPLNLNTRY